MKKKLLVVSMAAISIFMAACGSNETKETSSSYNEPVENTNEGVTTYNAEATYEVDGKVMNEDEYNQYLAEQDTEETNSEKILDIYVGDTFTLSDGTNELEITFNGVDFEQEVHSTSDNMYQQYFADKEEESYIVMKLDIKNVGGNSISDKVFTGYNSDKAEYGKILLTFDDKYNYQMQQLDTESMVMSKYWSIEPLKSQAIYFLQSVPDELVETPYTITFSLVDDDTICRYTKE